MTNELNRFDYAFQTLTQLREEVGTGIYDRAVKKINQQRLNNAAGREKREKFSWGVYKRHYARQRGICPWCKQIMPLIRGEIEMDHIDPNAIDFNADNNLQVLHAKCNHQKNTMPIPEQAKHLGTTYREILDNEI